MMYVNYHCTKMILLHLILFHFRDTFENFKFSFFFQSKDQDFISRKRGNPIIDIIFQNEGLRYPQGRTIRKKKFKIYFHIKDSRKNVKLLIFTL